MQSAPPSDINSGPPRHIFSKNILTLCIFNPTSNELDFRISNIFEMEILYHLDKQKIGVRRLILKILDSNFTCNHNFYSRTNQILTKDHFFINENMIFSKTNSGWTSLRGP